MKAKAIITALFLMVGLAAQADNDRPIQFDQLPKPAQLQAMLSWAERLSAPFTHARIDFFLVSGKLIFGEVTFTNGAGFDPITPREFDLEMGSWLQLPNR